MKKQAGFTLLEALIAVTILTVIMGISGSYMISSQKNQTYIRVQNGIKSEVERSLFQISKQLNQNRMLIDNPTHGSGLDYLSRINFSGIPAPIANTTLPTIRDRGSMAVEKDCINFPNNFYWPNAVGNALFFSKYTSKFNGATLSNQDFARQLDIYEFKFFYISEQSPQMTKIDRWNNPSQLNSQQLMEWTSVKYVDSDQLEAYLQNLIAHLTAADAAAVRTALIAKGINFAWDKNATTLNNSFFDVSGAGGTLASNSSHTIPRATLRNALLLNSDQQTTYSVSYNKLNSPGNVYHFPIRMQVPMYYNYNVPNCSSVTPLPRPLANSTVDQSLGTFPRGFEVGIVGSASGRSVIMHLSMVGIGNYNNIVQHAHTVVAYAKDR